MTKLIRGAAAVWFVMWCSVAFAGGGLDWVARSHNNDDQYGAEAAPLADGGVIVTGWFAGEATFGAGEHRQTTLESAGLMDMYFARYASLGELVWAKSVGAQGWDEGWAVSTFSDGSFAVGGFFQNTVVFGDGEPNETSLVASGSDSADIFVAKYSADGKLIWAKKAGGSNDGETVRRIVALQDGGCVALGPCVGTSVFGAGEANETIIQNSSHGLFVAKYQAEGSLAWVKSIPAVTQMDDPSGLGVAEDGSVLVGGKFSGDLVMGLDDPNQTELFSNGLSDIFIGKYSANGDFLWAKRAGGINYDVLSDMDVLSDGSFIFTGYFSGQITFGPSETEPIVLNGNDSKAYIARYDAEGLPVWARSNGGDASEEPMGVTAFSNGKFAITGTFSGMSISADYPSEYFVASYNANGSLAWVRRIQAHAQYETRLDIAATSGNSLVVVGGFVDDATFNLLEPDRIALQNDTANSLFVAKYQAVTPQVIAVESLPMDGVEITGFVTETTPFALQGDTGQPFALIAPDEFNSMSFFRWQDAQGKVLSDDRTLVLNTSADATVVAVYGSLEITVPVGDASLERGQKSTIQWDTNLPSTQLKIELINGSGGTWEITPKASSVKEAFSWTVGKVKSKTVPIPDGDDFRLRISTMNDAVEGISEEFAIGVPVSLQIQGPTTIAENSTAQYTAITSFNFGSPSDVTALAKWKSVGKYGKVKKGGVLTTKEVVGSQPVQITATYGKKPNIQIDTLDVTVTDAP